MKKMNLKIYKLIRPPISYPNEPPDNNHLSKRKITQRLKIWRNLMKMIKFQT
jgi:hypothetical protein